MNLLASAIVSLIHNEDGATMVEYALMLAGVAIACFAAVQALGTKTNELYQSCEFKP